MKLILNQQNGLAESRQLCEELMKYPHYQKIGNAGIMAIVEKARSVGVNPMDALNGGMYFVNGKVEMSAMMMNQLIRQHKHSITKDRKSDETICILHGKRGDTGDTWTESFSVEDAKLAGIYKNQWLKYPKDMLFARALSRLARQLYPDVIKGCYVENELSAELPPTMPAEKVYDLIALKQLVLGRPEIKADVDIYMERTGMSFEELPGEVLEKIEERINTHKEESSNE